INYVARHEPRTTSPDLIEHKMHVLRKFSVTVSYRRLLWATVGYLTVTELPEPRNPEFLTRRRQERQAEQRQEKQDWVGRPFRRFTDFDHFFTVFTIDWWSSGRQLW